VQYHDGGNRNQAEQLRRKSKKWVNIVTTKLRAAARTIQKPWKIDEIHATDTDFTPNMG
jgi:hypothetical protein